ncbi:DUF7344 domain-containing protein [Natronomonas sp. EA1]|uniref:DUF7344 domain-containing protein n=1 Tax=Natronomonas sp. EA1 TaxID=3421655 RepID=UPI003EBCD303
MNSELSVQAAYRVLADDRARAVVTAVAETGGLSLDALARMLAAREQGVPPERLDEQAVRNVRVSLRDDQLPCLAAHGILGLDGDAVTPGSNLGELVAAEDAIQEALRN